MSKGGTETRKRRKATSKPCGGRRETQPGPAGCFGTYIADPSCSGVNRQRNGTHLLGHARHLRLAVVAKRFFLYVARHDFVMLLVP